MNNSHYTYMGPPQIPPVDVDDALQYTPLASVVPFAPDMIPLPILSTTMKSIFQSDADKQSSRNALDILDGHSEAHPDSKIVRKYLHAITNQVGSTLSTGFRFKALQDSRPPDGVNQRAIELLRGSQAGQFAELVVGRTVVPYTSSQSSPVTDRRKSTIPQNHLQPQTPVRSTAPPQNSHLYTDVRPTTPTAQSPYFGLNTPISNTPGDGYRQPSFQVMIPVQTPSQEHKHNGVRSPTPPGSQVVEAVVIKPSPLIDRSQYIQSEKLDHVMRKSKPFASNPNSKNRKRKRASSYEEDDTPLNVGIDQRAREDGLLVNLQGLVDAIFQAEDNIQPDTSGRYAERSENSKFWLLGTTDGDNPCLSTAMQTKLEVSIRRVISVKRFAKIPVDDLIRLEKLCENSLKRTEALSIMPPIDDTGAQTEDWLGRIGSVDNGLKTARTVLRIMLGGREEKQLYSEDLLANVLFLVKNLIEGAINPMVEMRLGGDQQEIFKSAIVQKKILGGLLHELTNVLSLFSQMVANEEATESAVTSALYMAASIVFIENAGNEKDSIFGIQRVEMFRLSAMDIFTSIFARYPEQRSTIFENILTNLEKLPVNRATARQFKLVEGGKNIQLVSALIMRLVQTSGTYQPRKRKREFVSDDGELQQDRLEETQEQADRSPDEVVMKLRSICSPLLESASKNATSVISYLVKKAMTSTKSGDQPYRHLLDIFTEDFLAVLGSPEWPGAELLLRSLVFNMCNIVDQEKPGANIKTMAIDMLGVMGCGICDLQVHFRESHRSREGGEDSIDAHITQLTDKHLEIVSGGNKSYPAGFDEELLDWEGPYRVALEHLFEARSKDKTLQSACGYYLTLWSSKICTAYEKAGDDDDRDMDIARCASNLKGMTLGREWDDDMDLDDFTQSQIRQAYALTVLNMPFCMSFEKLLSRLLRGVDDNQAQSRSKSLKALMLLISKDPTILERTQVVPYIMKKAEDPSPLVRDSAVDMLGKCISIKPELEGMVCKTIVARANDTGVAVRKRSMKILRGIYLHTKVEVFKVLIAEALIQRIKDSDSSCADQAKKTFEEIWIAPFYDFIGNNEEDGKDNTDITPQMKLIANERVAVIIKVVQKETMLTALHEVIKSLLQQDNNKNSSRNFRVCKTMVGSMFDDLLDRQGDSDKTDRENTMQTLTVFAKANPRLFTPEQLIMLQPYTENLTSDDLHLFRSVIRIYRFALSVLTNRQSTFLQSVQSSLLKNLTRLPGTELNEVVSCLWTITNILNSPNRLMVVTKSCLVNVSNSEIKQKYEPLAGRKLLRTLHILGLFGHYCDFEDLASDFKPHFPKWDGKSVSGLTTDTIAPFCAEDVDPEVRKAAIESLGRVCQTHPPHFLKSKVLEIFDQVFKEQDKECTTLILDNFKGFLMLEESRSEFAMSDDTGAKDKKGVHAEEPGRLTQAAYANQNDGVSTTLAQKYMKDIIEISKRSQDNYALLAIEVIASILRQGLVHPKELVPTIVALETSTNPAISQIAYKEHKSIHGKHETIVERGYMDGARACFKYQRDIVGDGCGATKEPFVAKLRPLYDVLKDGSRKVRKKFLSNLTMSIDFDPTKLNLDVQPVHIEYAKFAIQNLAFFDYVQTDEVYQIVSTMEKVVAGTGVIVAHSIETDIFFIKLENEQENQQKTIDPKRLKLLSTGAAILMMVWAARSHLRKAYGVNENKYRDFRLGKVRANDPLLNKAPTRNPNVNPNTVWEQIEGTHKCLESGSEMMEQCRQFVELLNVDNEFKLAAEGDDEETALGMGNTPEPSGDEAPPVPSTPKGRKRKGSADVGEKSGKRKKPNPRKKKSKDRDG